MNILISERTTHIRSLISLGGFTAVGGAVVMLIGAIFYGSTGTDLWFALQEDDLAGFLATAGGVKLTFVLNITFWITGVLVLGVAGHTLTALSERRPIPALIARHCFSTAVPLAIVAFLAMLAIVLQLAPNNAAGEVAVAKTIGWVGARADDIATALIAGIGPFFIALSGRGDWMPTWLTRWGYLAGLVGVFSLAVLFSSTLGALGLIIVPVGLGWMIAAGIVLLRRSRLE